MSCLLEPPVPHLTNAAGEDLLTRIRFDITDAARLETALDSADELEREQEKSTWRWFGANSNGGPLRWDRSSSTAMCWNWMHVGPAR